MINPTPKRWRLAAAAVLVLLAINFVMTTRGVRIANGDDVEIQKVFSKHDPAAVKQFFSVWSHDQGRFYFALPTYRLPYTIYLLEQPLAFSSARALLLLLQFVLLGGLVARLFKDETSGWLSALLTFGAMHIPSIFYPILSYPAYSAGSIAILLSLHCFLSVIDCPNKPLLVAAAFLQLAALLWHENFVVITAIYPALILATRTARGLGAAVRTSLPFILIALAYVCTYFVFKGLHPTQYDGTVFSVNPRDSIVAWTRQTVGATPGFELIVNRPSPYPSSGPFLKTSAQVIEILHSVPVPGLVLAAIVAMVTTGLLWRSETSVDGQGKLVLLFLFASTLPNLLPALTAKYQINAYHRFYPYVYSFSSYCWCVAAFVAVWLWLSRKAELKGKSKTICLSVLFVPELAIFVSAQASNANTLHLLRGWFN